jgi:hypothetical protein
VPEVADVGQCNENHLKQIANVTGKLPKNQSYIDSEVEIRNREDDNESITLAEAETEGLA